MFFKERGKFATWRRRSEPCRETSLTVLDVTDESATEWNVNESKTDDEAEEMGATKRLPTLHVQADLERNESRADSASDLGSETCIPQRCPESLEHIVEQLVLQNVEIQRILQRQKRRAFRNTSAPRRPVRSETVDEGIYDSLIMSPPVLSDADGEYVTICTDRLPVPAGSSPESDACSQQDDAKSHFSRCQMRRSLGSLRKKPGPAPDSSAEQTDPGRATIGRSLSCPARQAVRIARKSETESVGSRIQKILNQIGSPDHWSNWMRSLSPPQRQRRDSRDSTDLKLECDPELNEAKSPCVPSVWLRMQSEHLADPNKKSGSLPRSFQVTP